MAVLRELMRIGKEVAPQAGDGEAHEHLGESMEEDFEDGCFTEVYNQSRAPLGPPGTMEPPGSV